MHPYKIGDVVRVYHYPYLSKTEKQRIIKEGTKDEHPLFYMGNVRYGVVVGTGGKNIKAVPVVQIMSHGGETEKEGYMLRDDEVRVPQRTLFVDKHGEQRYLYGVIKMERIEMFGQDEITAPLTEIPLRIKIEMLERYEAILKNHYYKNKLDKDSPNHKLVMKAFKDAIIAEKLNFLVDSQGVNRFEFIKHTTLTLEELQKVGKYNNLTVYSVRLKGKYDIFTYNIATRKKETQIVKDWDKPKVASQWLKEDAKYHALMNNIDQNIRTDPSPHPDKYVTFESFKKRILQKQNENDLDR